MPSTRKRLFQEFDTPATTDHPEESSLLHRLRNTWQFANLCQWIFLFGPVVKLDKDFDIDTLETECLKPDSKVLQDIGLSLLKFLSSHRGLTHELFDEYTRRQFLSRAPEKNPFGTDEVPRRFADFDVITKIRVLQQMTQFIMMSPERLREKTEEQKDIDQTNWRIEPYGWDRHDNTYFVLDDNRIYRLTKPAPAPAKPKKNTKKAKAALRASKRRRISASNGDDAQEVSADTEPSETHGETQDDGLGGMKWECLAVTLDEARAVLSRFERTTDANERILRDQIREHLIPILEKQEESRKRRQLQREKELLNLQKMAYAKRSSRIASKLDRQRAEEEAREEERRKREQEEAARKEEEKRLKMERERENRLRARERRLKEREARRQQHQEELAQLSEDSKKLGTTEARMSERRLQAEIEMRQQALKELEEEEEDWIFDCICGVYGQIDDGSHSVACERCNVWQHSKCLGVDEKEADKDDFHFICETCRRRESDQRPRVIKIKVNPSGSASSSPAQRGHSEISPEKLSKSTSELVAELQSNGLASERTPSVAGTPADFESCANGNALGDTMLPPIAQTSTDSPTRVLDFARAPECAPAVPGTFLAPATQGLNPFSNPHPTLSPPDQSPNKSRAYHTISDPVEPTTSTLNGHSMVANIASPSKQPTTTPPETKTTPPSLSAPPGPNYASSPNFKSISPNASMTAPRQVTPNDRASLGYDENLSPLPSSRAGMSPTKQPSPPLNGQHLLSKHLSNGSSPSNGVVSLSPAANTSPKSSIFPPVATLSPSLPEQILTPPVKHSGTPGAVQHQLLHHVSDTPSLPKDSSS
ncbi:hypothetical protein VTK73DRAFT_10202 [Phialemonium thermophilum]|uniref:Zinc finger PHD-type domain-containing protein n=1 Tax=Phialemonium thermophilum TaxID=223376 RepID=A0ABR3XH75_9PEZI